jgi:hypothetical protein
MDRPLDSVPPLVGVVVGRPVEWVFAWQLPADQGGYQVPCSHRHRHAVDALTCYDRLMVETDDQGWIPLGVRPVSQEG